MCKSPLGHNVRLNKQHIAVACERKLAPMNTETLAGEWHQTWAYERAAQLWRFDVFREPHDGDTWICRRYVDPAAVPRRFRGVGGRDPLPKA